MDHVEEAHKNTITRSDGNHGNPLFDAENTCVAAGIEKVKMAVDRLDRGEKGVSQMDAHRPASIDRRSSFRRKRYDARRDLGKLERYPEFQAPIGTWDLVPFPMQLCTGSIIGTAPEFADRGVDYSLSDRWNLG